MMGDFLGVYGSTYSVVNGSVSSSARRVVVASRAGSGFKIGDNESPIPMDRVFLNNDYFSHIRAYGAEDGSSNLNREIFGFEKTFLDGSASIGMRVPFYQAFSGDATAGSRSGLGDVTMIGKFVLLGDAKCGNLVSGGLAVTAPTGGSVFLIDGHKLDDVLLQPFVGYLYNSESFYVHGFLSAILPTDSKDVTLVANDIGVGYKLYSNCDGSMLSALIPTVELHENTPLNHRGLGSSSDIAFSDALNFTGGVHVGLWNKAWLTVGGVTPLTGPRLNDVEGIVQFNCRF